MDCAGVDLPNVEERYREERRKKERRKVPSTYGRYRRLPRPTKAIVHPVTSLQLTWVLSPSILGIILPL